MGMSVMILEIILLSALGRAVLGGVIDTSVQHTQKTGNTQPANHPDSDYLWSPSSDLFASPSADSSFVRFARNPNGFVRFGRSGGSFVRFGRDGQFYGPRNDRTGRDDSFVRFGRSRSLGENKRIASHNFLRFGRYNDNNRIRFSGKRNGSGGVLRKLPDDFEYLLNDLVQPQQSSKSVEHLTDVGDEQPLHDNISLDELYRNQEQAEGVANDASVDK